MILLQLNHIRRPVCQVLRIDQSVHLTLLILNHLKQLLLDNRSQVLNVIVLIRRFTFGDHRTDRANTVSELLITQIL